MCLDVGRRLKHTHSYVPTLNFETSQVKSMFYQNKQRPGLSLDHRRHPSKYIFLRPPKWREILALQFTYLLSKIVARSHYNSVAPRRARVLRSLWPRQIRLRDFGDGRNLVKGPKCLILVSENCMAK